LSHSSLLSRQRILIENLKWPFMIIGDFDLSPFGGFGNTYADAGRKKK